MKKGGFELSKWKSNHQRHLALDEDGNQPQDVDDTHVKVLGVHWNTKEDIFCFNIDKSTVKPLARSPRELVAVQCSLFNKSS